MESAQSASVVPLDETQRRVLGVLLEKAFTTPEYYPMTLKGLTSGCNQKNNRDPVLDLSEDDVDEAVSTLEKLQLTERIFPESGRTERIRHWARKKFTLSEPQLAIMTELWLRGRQSLGDLRVRASRMEPIADLDTLRAELKGLVSLGMIQANGPLESRGVEIDHCCYLPAERRSLPPLAAASPAPTSSTVSSGATSPSAVQHSSAASNAELAQLKQEQAELKAEVVRLRALVEELSDRVARIASDLGIS